MPDHAAFLKGMNLGRRRLANDELRSAVESLGFADVQTFRASGNVGFTAGSRSPADLQDALEVGLRDVLGYAVPVFIRNAAELREIAGGAPFGAAPAGGKPQVALLREAPSAAARASVLELAGEDEQMVFGERELHWLPAGRISDSTLDFGRVERLLGPTTVRTLGTIEQIVARWL